MSINLADLQQQIKSAVASVTRSFKVGDADFADIVQDVNMRLLVVGATYDEKKGASASTWAYTIARNIALDAMRSRSRHETEELDETVLTFAGASAVAALVEQEKANLLEQGICALPREEADFIRAILSGVEIEEYAASHGTTPNACFIKKHRIVKKLRAWMRGKNGS